MHPKSWPWRIFLHFLLLSMIVYVNGHRFHHQGHSISSSSPHHMDMDMNMDTGMDHSVLVFFTLNDLKLGNTMPIFFRGKNNNNNNSPHFLPREEAESIPFSHSKLPFLLQYFGFSKSSTQAQAMEETLRQCETQPIQGETKFCATSLESMLDFVHKIFGKTTKFEVLSTQNFMKDGSYLQNYSIIEEPREVKAPKMVACHTVPYPYVVYYCHYQKSESKVFQVSLSPENKNNNEKIVVKAIAVCHMDTSKWSPNHVSFRVLGSEPGSSPVCHFFPADNLVWVPRYEIQGSTHQLSVM